MVLFDDGAVVITYQRSIGRWVVFLKKHLVGSTFYCLLFVMLCGIGLTPGASFADSVPIEAFFGTYQGTSTESDDRKSASRDLAVSIRKHGRGFNVAWSTTKADGSRKSYSVDFEETNRPGIFSSAMRYNKFGDSVPLDPLKGDSYIWARITGRTLTVYGFIITEEGSYEMQVYNRTLSEKGLDLKFSRYLEGEPVRVITGTLFRVDE